MRRHGIKRQGFGARADKPAVYVNARQHRGTAPDGKYDPRRFKDRGAAVGGGHLDTARPGQPSAAGVAGDLVFLQQRLDALAERRDNLIFPSHHRGQIERHAADLHAMAGQFMPRLFVLVARFEKGFRRDAAHP